MEKRAITEYDILELLARRWSPIAFDPRPVPRKVLERMFEAARWAASSNNEQPWNYIVGVKANDPEQFDRLASVLMPGNAWARNAPVLALSVAKTTFARNGAPNRVAFHDVGMATENLIIQGLSEGVFVHQMGGYDVERAKQVFEIPDGYEPVAMIALGYPGDPDQLDEKSKARELSERKRKKSSEFLFESKFGGGRF